jgi:hypothetical protein
MSYGKKYLYVALTIVAILLILASPVHADNIIIKCYPIAQNINGGLIVSEKCDTHILPSGSDFNGKTHYAPNESARGFAMPDNKVIESGIRGAAIGRIYSTIPFSWILVR